ncbi:MAG: cbb3-type cytochrome c oxidase subunit II [Candidatus Caldarchaeum sp.]
MGITILVLFLMQFVVGALISMKYIPDPYFAYKFVEDHRPIMVFSFLFSFHYYASATILFLGGIFNALLLWNARWSWQDRWLWWGGLGLLGTAFLSQITGNLLPGSTHDVRTAFIEASIARGIPGVGPKIFEELLGGSEISGETFRRWYFLHRVGVTALFLLSAGMLLVGLRQEKGSALSRFLPSLVLISLVGIAASVEAPFGSAPREVDSKSLDARPMWYVLPMHALLRWTTSLNPEAGWIGAILLPGGVLVSLVLLPVVFRRGLPLAVGRLSTTALVVGMVMLVIAYGGQLQNPFNEESIDQNDSINPAGTEKIDASLAERGLKAFREAGCLRCHRVGSMGSAVIGPDLAGVGRKYASREWFLQKMRNPETLSPGSRMPSFSHLSEEKLQAIAEYLRSLRND